MGRKELAEAVFQKYLESKGKVAFLLTKYFYGRKRSLGAHLAHVEDLYGREEKKQAVLNRKRKQSKPKYPFKPKLNKSSSVLAVRSKTRSKKRKGGWNIDNDNTADVVFKFDGKVVRRNKNATLINNKDNLKPSSISPDIQEKEGYILKNSKNLKKKANKAHPMDKKSNLLKPTETAIRKQVRINDEKIKTKPIIKKKNFKDPKEIKRKHQKIVESSNRLYGLAEKRLVKIAKMGEDLMEKYTKNYSAPYNEHYARHHMVKDGHVANKFKEFNPETQNEAVRVQYVPFTPFQMENLTIIMKNKKLKAYQMMRKSIVMELNKIGDEENISSKKKKEINDIINKINTDLDYGSEMDEL